MIIRGKCSWFGGPDDTGVAPDEGLAFIFDVEDAPHLFLPAQPPGTTGLARRLDADNRFYIACRWDYDAPNTSKADLLKHVAFVRATKTGRQTRAFPADWGPNENTGRVADLSPALMVALGIETDDEVEIIYPYDNGEEQDMAEYSSIVISSGHSSKCPGASGILDEVTEARKVVNRLVEEFKKRGCKVEFFHDDVSTTVSQNLDRIVDFHNSKERQLDISCHFNAYVETTKPMGTEVLYVTQSELATRLSAAIASVGLIDRGGKHRTDLAFLNNTEMPSVLLEIAFCDSTADCSLYQERFDDICAALADELCGEYEGGGEERPPPSERPPRPERPPAVPHVDIVCTGDVIVTINGVPVTS